MKNQHHWNFKRETCRFKVSEFSSRLSCLNMVGWFTLCHHPIKIVRLKYLIETKIQILWITLSIRHPSTPVRSCVTLLYLLSQQCWPIWPGSNNIHCRSCLSKRGIYPWFKPGKGRKELLGKKSRKKILEIISYFVASWSKKNANGLIEFCMFLPPWRISVGFNYSENAETYCKWILKACNFFSEYAKTDVTQFHASHFGTEIINDQKLSYTPLTKLLARFVISHIK